MPVAIGALLVSFIFPLSIYFFLKNAHKEDEKYRNDCRSLLLKGLLLGFPVFGFSLLCSILFSLSHISEKYPYAEKVFSAFVLAALSEELMKYLLAKKVAKENMATISFLDLMSFTTISAIGFELMEAVFYMFSTNIPQILVRGITSMHASFGLVMGFFLARGVKKHGKMLMFPGVLISTLIHGTYDLLVDPEILDTPWGGVALLLAFLCLVLNIYNFFFMKKARKNPYYTDPLFPELTETEQLEENASAE